MEPIINLKLLEDDAYVPCYETELASGFDLGAYLDDPSEPIVIEPGKWKLVKTRLAMAIPKGYELQIRPRSGLALKHGITVLNAPGTIDADYRGEIGVILLNLGDKPFTVNHGERIAQGVVSEVKQVYFRFVDELDETERGEGGFGSTGV